MNTILSITKCTGTLVQLETCVQVADMKNSVKDRSNAQCSCAGHFIESHIDPNYNGKKINFDITLFSLFEILLLTHVLF